MSDLFNIPTTLDRCGRHLESATIVVKGLQRTSFNITHLAIVPEGQEGRQVFQGPMVPGPWGFTVTHALVIDNHGGSAREAAEAPIRVTVGEPFTVEGLPGVWTFASPRGTHLDGGGPRLVKYDSEAA
jgi:hypothetical protein